MCSIKLICLAAMLSAQTLAVSVPVTQQQQQNIYEAQRQLNQWSQLYPRVDQQYSPSGQYGSYAPQAASEGVAHSPGGYGGGQEFGQSYGGGDNGNHGAAEVQNYAPALEYGGHAAGSEEHETQGHDFGGGNGGHDFGGSSGGHDFGGQTGGHDFGGHSGGHDFSGGEGGHEYGHVQPIHKHVHVEDPEPIKHYKEIAIPIHKNYEVKVHQPVIIPVPHQVPIQVPVPKIVVIPIVKEVTVPVEKSVPYPVEKIVHYPVFKKVPFNVYKHIVVPVEKPVPFKVPVLETIVHHSKGKH